MSILPMRAAALGICRGPDQIESLEKPAPERSEAGFVFLQYDRRLACQAGKPLSPLPRSPPQSTSKPLPQQGDRAP